VDYDKQLVSFSEPDELQFTLIQPDTAWQEVPLEIDSRMPYLKTRVETADKQLVTVKLLVDTGSTGSLSLNPGSHKSINVPDYYYSTVSQGLTGDTVSMVSMTESLAIGGYQLSNLAVSYPVSGEYSESDSNGILGNEVLSRFDLIFDYPNKRLLVAPNQRFTLPITGDRSGLRVLPHRSGGIVKSVARGTGAQAIELREGDIITHFDEMPLTKLNIDELHRVFVSQREVLPICWMSAEQKRCDTLRLASRFK